MPIVFKKVKSVTRPVLQIETKPVYVTIQEPIFKAKEIAAGRNRSTNGTDGQPMAPPELANVINLETGEEQVIVVNTVLGSTLREEYPNETYVGKSFELVKFKPEGNKRYAKFSIAEVSVTTDEAEAEKAAATVQTPKAPEQASGKPATPATGKGK